MISCVLVLIQEEGASSRTVGLREAFGSQLLHLDLSSGGIKLQTLWFFSVDLVLGYVISTFSPKIVVLVNRSYSRTFKPHIWSLLRLLSHKNVILWVFDGAC